MGAARSDLMGQEQQPVLGGNPPPERAQAEERPEVLEREVEEIRDNISGIVGELDRRRQELFDWRQQLRNNALLIAAIGASCVAGFGLTVAIGAVQRRRRNRPMAKMRRLREALARIIAHPELVAQPRPSVSKRAVAAAVSALVSVLARTLAERVLDAAEREPALLTARTE